MKRLSADQIVEAAISHLDAEGLDGLSMRSLATTLGVQAMSLYNHFANKAAILEAVHARLLETIPPPASHGPWQDAVRAVAFSFRKLLRTHPQAIPLFAATAAVTPGSLAFLDAGVAVFRRAGMTPDESLQAFQSLFYLVLGHAMANFARGTEPPGARTGYYRDYAHLSEVTLLDDEAELVFALETFIAGLEERLSSQLRATPDGGEARKSSPQERLWPGKDRSPVGD